MHDDAPRLAAELPAQPRIGDRLHAVSRLARTARGEPHSRLATSLKYSQRPGRKGDEDDEPRAQRRAGQHQRGRERDTKQQRDATDDVAPVLPARPDIARR